MQFTERTTLRGLVSDPEMLARLERNLRSAGMPRRCFLAMASTVAGTAALAACGGSRSPAPPAPTAAATASSTIAGAAGADSKKVLIVPTTVEPVDNDTNRDLGGYGQISQSAGLLKYDQDTQIQPDLAESYTSSGPVFIFKMRAGAVWSDGVPVTAMDFVYSVRRMIDPRTGNSYGSYWNGVIKGAAEFAAADRKAPAELDKLAQAVGVRAVDSSTFEVTGGDFFGLIPSQFAFKAAYPAREDQVKKFADAQGVSSWTDPGKTGAPVVSSGPFVLTAWKHNVQIEFVRNERYWNAKTIRQKYLTVRIIPDLAKTTLPFENNDIDFEEIPPTEVDRFKGDAKLKSQLVPVINPFTRFLVPDTGHSPFDKLDVRKATILAVDKDRLVKQVGKGIHTVAYAMTAPGTFGYFDDGDNKLKNIQKYDPTAALAALKGTTYEGGRNWPKVTLSYNASDTDIPAGTPDEIARQLKETLHMDVLIEPLEGKVWTARRYTLDLQFLLYRWGQDYPDPHDNYYLVFSIHNKGSARQSYTDPEFDRLTTTAAAESEAKKRLDLYYQAETRLQTQFAYMPLYWQTAHYAVKPWLMGLPKNLYFVRPAETVFVADDSPHDPP